MNQVSAHERAEQGTNEVSRPLDFLVIGASKSGTTSLFEYLRRHPQIFIPPEKEAPFFADERLYGQGLDWYLSEFFSAAPADARWGTVSPQYLEDAHRSADRIAHNLPEVRLVVILRDPIERAYSAYRMRVMKGREQRSFDEVVVEQTKPEALERSRDLPWSPQITTHTYLVTSEYARQLQPFREHFAKDQFCLLLTEDLDSDPGGTLASLHDFLGVEEHTPANVGKRYYRGGSQRRLTGLIRTLAEIGPLKRLWRTIPRQKRRALLWKLQTEVLVSRDKQVEPLSAESRQRLRELLTPDVDKLRSDWEIEVPWPDFKTPTSS